MALNISFANPVTVSTVTNLSLNHGDSHAYAASMTLIGLVDVKANKGMMIELFDSPQGCELNLWSESGEPVLSFIKNLKSSVEFVEGQALKIAKSEFQGVTVKNCEIVPKPNFMAELKMTVVTPAIDPKFLNPVMKLIKSEANAELTGQESLLTDGEKDLQEALEEQEGREGNVSEIEGGLHQGIADPLFEEAREYVITHASSATGVATIQNALKISHQRAQKILDGMIDAKILSKPDAAGMCEIQPEAIKAFNQEKHA